MIRRRAVHRLTSTLMGAAVIAIGAVSLAALDGRELDFELIWIVALGVAGLWLLLTAVLASFAPARSKRASRGGSTGPTPVGLEPAAPVNSGAASASMSSGAPSAPVESGADSVPPAPVSDVLAAEPSAPEAPASADPASADLAQADLALAEPASAENEASPEVADVPDIEPAKPPVKRAPARTAKPRAKVDPPTEN